MRADRSSLHGASAWRRGLPLTLALGACAPAATSQPASAPESPAVSQTPAPEPQAPPARRAPLPETLAVMPADGAFYVHVDGARLRQSPLFGVYHAAMEDLDDDPIARARKECGFDPLVALREGAVSGRVVPDSGPAVVAALLLDRDAGEGLQCLQQLGAEPDAALGGLALGNGALAVAAGRLLIVGDVAGVRLAAERAKRGSASQLPSPVRDALDDHPTAALIAVGKLGDALRESPFGWTTLSATSSPDRFALEIDADAMDPQAAKTYAMAFDPSRLFAGAKRGDVPQTRIWTEGQRLRFELSVDGGPTLQAFQLGVASAVAIAGVRRYLARAKSSEATHTVAQIAKDLAAHTEGKPLAARRFPASAPPTPKQVPAGKKAQLGADAWNHPTWKAIGFSIAGPVYYSYEIVTARGGKSAVVRATGDLDGDGVLSIYSLKLEIDGSGAVQMASAPEVEHELE